MAITARREQGPPKKPIVTDPYPTTPVQSPFQGAGDEPWPLYQGLMMEEFMLWKLTDRHDSMIGGWRGEGEGG